MDALLLLAWGAMLATPAVADAGNPTYEWHLPRGFPTPATIDQRQTQLYQLP
jgi:hypothetical protein